MKTFQDGDPVFGVMMNAIANLWPNGTAVLSGCTPTGSGAARQVTVAAGTVVIGGTVRSVSQQTKTLDAATFDRYDLISVNTSGTVVVTKGTEERRVPALPANSVPIAICLVETGQTTLPADRIYDSRVDALRLSVLNIDADKDCNGRNFTNLGYITANKIRPVASTEVRASGETSCTIPAVYMEGTVLIKAQALASQVGTVKINGVVAFTWGPSSSGEWVEKIWPIKGGDVVTFHTTTSDGCSISCSDTAPVAYPAPPTW
jgi:hypothetical protein